MLSQNRRFLTLLSFLFSRVYLIKHLLGIIKINIFGLKNMVKSGLENIFFEIPPCAKPFSDMLIYSIKGRVFVLNYNIVTNTCLRMDEFQNNSCI